MSIRVAISTDMEDFPFRAGDRVYRPNEYRGGAPIVYILIERRQTGTWVLARGSQILEARPDEIRLINDYPASD